MIEQPPLKNIPLKEQPKVRKDIEQIVAEVKESMSKGTHRDFSAAFFFATYNVEIAGNTISEKDRHRAKLKKEVAGLLGIQLHDTPQEDKKNAPAKVAIRTIPFNSKASIGWAEKYSRRYKEDEEKEPED